MLMSGLQILLIDIQHLAWPLLTSQTLTHPEGEIFPALTSPSTVNTNLELTGAQPRHKHNSIDNPLLNVVTKLYSLGLVRSFLTFKLNSPKVLGPLKIIIFPLSAHN